MQSDKYTRKKPALTVIMLIWLLGMRTCLLLSETTHVQEGEFWLICTDEDASTLGRTLLQTVLSETKAENLNIKEEKCDMKQSVKGTGDIKMKKDG